MEVIYTWVYMMNSATDLQVNNCFNYLHTGYESGDGTKLEDNTMANDELPTS